MNYKLFFFLFVLNFSTIGFAQTGTTKIAKPKEDKVVPILPKKDSTAPFKRQLYLSVDFSTNYTFKGNNKVGFDGGILFRYSIFKNSKFKNFVIGFQYDYENIYYKLSAYNKLTKQTEISYTNSQNISQFIKMPIRLQGNDIVGGARWSGMGFIGITPKYLLKNKNELDRLNTNDFNQFNLSWTIGIGHRLFKQIWYKVEYSKDFFQNLKDIHVYNSNGEVIGKQKSQTNLFSFTIFYRL